MSQITINENDVIIAANAVDYVEHAVRINDVARMLLRLESLDADWLAGKISLGLSLQAVELAGKAVLRALEKYSRYQVATRVKKVFLNL